MGKGLNKPITIRLPPDEEAYYRRMSSLHGMSLSAFLTKTLVAGVIAESMAEFEGRVRELVGQIQGAVAQPSGRLPEDILLSVFTIEAMLAAVVEAQDVQTLYSAQEAAKARLKRRKAT